MKIKTGQICKLIVQRGVFLSILLVLFSYQAKAQHIQMPEVIVVNMGEGDREYIGKLLMAIDSCQPFLVVLDAYFANETGKIGDSILSEGLRKCKNDLIIYIRGADRQIIRSSDRFRALADGEGIISFDKIDGLTSHFTPLEEINGITHKHIALKIIERVKPDIRWKYGINESVPIKFTRTLSELKNIKVLDIEDDPKYLLDYFKGRIVLLGYAGPSNENKYYTPARKGKEFGYDPDTYGVVILANILSTVIW